MARHLYLLDANAIIEAVRTGIWNAITGALSIHTVATCAGECRNGDRFSSGYVVVSEADLSRTEMIHTVSEADVAAVLLMDKSDALHPGELELFAHALKDPDSDVSLICSPDLASVKFAVVAGIADRLTSLEDTMSAAGAKPKLPLRGHFTASWLSAERTKARLGVR